MKIIGFILGLIALAAGLSLTGWVWYRAANGQIDESTAYAGPVLIVLGGLRIVRAAAVVPLQLLARLAVIGMAILCGYGNSAIMKTMFPNDQILKPSTH
jgi:hypothetical protein